MPDLLIYDEIVSPQERKLWGIGVDAEAFSAQLDKTAGDITVRINSPGGDVDNGLAIHNRLQAERAKGRKVTCIVDGGAHSIASVIACAADEVHMAEASRMLVHNPRMMAMGTAEDMRQAAQRLDAAAESIRAAYRHKTKMSDAALDALMAAETFLTSAAAQRLAFADKVITPPERMTACAWSLATLRHPISRAVALLLDPQPAPPAPQAKGKEMTEPENELVPKADLAAAQTERAAIQQRMDAAAPVIAMVAKLTGKESAADQIAELAQLAVRVAGLPTAEQMRASERASLVAQLQHKQVPPMVLAALEAACDAAGGDLAVLRAGAAKLQPPASFVPATEQRNTEPPNLAAEAALNADEKAYYAERGISEEEALKRKQAGQEAIDAQQKGRK